MADPSQPSVTTQGNTTPTPQAQPQPGSSRLAGSGATVTEGGTMPFTPPPQRAGNAKDPGTTPFRVGGG